MDPDKIELISLTLGITLFILALSFAIYLHYREQKLLKKQAKKLYTESFPKVQYIEIDNIRFCYQQIGTGPHLILLHGLGANIFTWRFVLNKLSKHFTVTTLDLPGFGNSSKDPGLNYNRKSQVKRVHAFLAALAIDRCYLIGSSMGGAISLEYVHTYPQQVEKLICLAPATHRKILPFNPKPFLLALSHTYRLVNRLLVKTLVLRVVYNKELVTAESVDRYYQPYKCNKDAIICALKSSETISQPFPKKSLANISSPILILYGENDAIVAKKYIDELMQYLPNTRLLTRTKVGHHSMEDAPEWIADNAITFFSKSSC